MRRAVFPVSLEILREGPPHNQLLSPLTRYLARCGDVAAQVVNVPYEHREFKSRLKPLRYAEGADDDELRRITIDQTANDMAAILERVPGFAATMNTVRSSHDPLIHLELVILPDELAMLPFELATVPENCPGSPRDYLSLQTVIPVTMTRRIRGVAPEDVKWNREPRVLFAWSEAGGAVNHDEHLEALWDAFYPINKPRGLVVEEPHASLSSIQRRIESGTFTHVHILAHGVESEAEQGFTSFELALNRPTSLRGHEGVSGQKLARVLCPVTLQKRNWPLVVSLAACDSSNEGGVLDRNGASIAQDLHRAGIPLVIGSQFPLTKKGSVLIARDFYGSILKGEDPRLSLHVLRGNLRQLPGTQHDWASLVVYAALNTDLRWQFGSPHIRLSYAKRMDKWAFSNLESGETSTVDDLTWGAMKDEVLNAIATYPTDGRFAAEGHGMKGSAFKRLAQASFYRTLGSEDPADGLARSLNALETSMSHYWQAAEIALGPPARKPRQLASLHWVLTQYLCLRAVLGDTLERDLWMTAKVSAEIERRQLGGLEGAWAAASLAELHLLQLALPSRNRSEAKCRSKALACVREIVELDPDPTSACRFSTSRGFRRYLDWWSTPHFCEALRERGLTRGVNWEKDRGVSDTARRLVEILDGNA